MDKIREEFEKYKKHGCTEKAIAFSELPQYSWINNKAEIRAFYEGYKFRDEEIHQLKEDLDENIERTKDAEMSTKIWMEEVKKFKSITDDYEHTYIQTERINKKLRDALEKIVIKTNPPMRDLSGACYYIAVEALKED